MNDDSIGVIFKSFDDPGEVTMVEKGGFETVTQGGMTYAR